MGRMRLLDKVFNASASQVEGFCIVKSVGIKTNVTRAANATPSFGITRRRYTAHTKRTRS